MNTGDVGALILAAGGSTRLGQPKQLLIYEGKTLVRRAVEMSEEAGLNPILVVAGDEFPRIKIALEGTPAYLFHHPAWSCGIGSSIRFGIEKLQSQFPTVEGVELLTCDQPLVTSSLLRELVSAWRAASADAVACGYADTIGIPALFDRSLFGRLLALNDGQGAKIILNSLGGSLATVDFPEGAVDIDTPEDWRLFGAPRKTTESRKGANSAT